MLAALDLLAVSNLVNYFGRQDEVDKVEISPIMMQKGETKVALYGMGSMRDERLNRMWQGKKVRFLRPEQDKDDQEFNSWFNIFTLHQNRDLGRGTKNCVHESMIPEWMDMVSIVILNSDAREMGPLTSRYCSIRFAGCLGSRTRVLD
jgi:double-strand break repair protein MRE11